MARISPIVGLVQVEQVVFRHRVVVIDSMGQQPFVLVVAFLGCVRGYQTKNSRQEAPHGCLQMWSKHVCGLSVTLPQKSGSRQERPTLENKTGSGYKTFPMLFLWVFLKTGSCCKT